MPFGAATGKPFDCNVVALQGAALATDETAFGPHAGGLFVGLQADHPVASREVGAQIISVDMYDALTPARSYRPAMTAIEAVARVVESRSAWRDDVYDAFIRSVGCQGRVA